MMSARMFDGIKRLRNAYSPRGEVFRTISRRPKHTAYLQLYVRPGDEAAVSDVYVIYR